MGRSSTRARGSPTSSETSFRYGPRASGSAIPRLLAIGPRQTLGPAHPAQARPILSVELPVACLALGDQEGPRCTARACRSHAPVKSRSFSTTTQLQYPLLRSQHEQSAVTSARRRITPGGTTERRSWEPADRALLAGHVAQHEGIVTEEPAERQGARGAIGKCRWQVADLCIIKSCMEPRGSFPTGMATAETAFAPAERATPPEVEASLAVLTGNPLVQALLDATDVSVIVLNRQRQILIANGALLTAMGDEMLQGLRPGEALGCVHAGERPGGCGTAPECAACGAVLAIIESQRTRSAVERECLLMVRHGQDLEARELLVRASPVEIGSETFTVVGLRDISAEKRRAALERVFLHDISNTLSPLLLSAQLLAIRAPDGVGETARRIAELAERLQGDIEGQRVLQQAEAGRLELRPASVRPEAALEAAVRLLRGHEVARGRALEIAPRDGVPAIVTDESLLVRVLVNMLKNALEATPEGGIVRAWAEPVADGCELRVWNATSMDRQVALQMFKRSFSTKPGRGRGLGTFSMKLFGERYLGGKVGFTSTEAGGTTFYIRLPRSTATTRSAQRSPER